jgi:hypothetical protein
MAADDAAGIEAIEKTLAARSRDALAGRATRIENLGQSELPDTRPQVSGARTSTVYKPPLRASGDIRLASLGHETPAMSAVPRVDSEPAGRTHLPDQQGARGPKLVAVIASLGREFALPDPAGERSLSGGLIRWNASPDCLAPSLRAVLVQVVERFGPLKVNSTCRSKAHNAAVGGATRSYHLIGKAVDFRVPGHFREILSFLTGLRAVGGLKHYGGGVFHIDTGPRRTWANGSYGRRAKYSSWRRNHNA